MIERLLPRAHEGLVGAGVEDEEAARWLAIIEARTASGQTGSRWQRRALARLERGRSREEGLRELVALYRAQSAKELPVHEWPEPS